MIALLILLTIVALGIIAWKSFRGIDEIPNNELRSAALKPVIKNQEFRLEAGEPISSERVITIIPTPRSFTLSPNISLDVMLQELEHSESKLQDDLFKELQNQMLITAKIMDQINEQFLITDMLFTLENELLSLHQMSFSFDAIQSPQSDDVEKY